MSKVCSDEEGRRSSSSLELTSERASEPVRDLEPEFGHAIAGGSLASTGICGVRSLPADRFDELGTDLSSEVDDRIRSDLLVVVAVECE